MGCKMVRTADGTAFVVPRFRKRGKVEYMSPCEFMAELLTRNPELSWASFNRSSITEVVNLAIRSFRNVATPLSSPFNDSDTKTSEEWEYIERVLRFSLPAVPTPEAVKMPLNASAPIFEHAEAIYKLPQVDDQIFGSEGLNIKHFLRAWIHLNKQNIDVVQVDLLKAALENFARQGFPGFPGLVTSLIEQFDHSDEREMMGQHWAIIWENLNAENPQGIMRAETLKVKQLEYSGQWGRVASTADPNRTLSTRSMTEQQLQVLRSEDRFLSITVPKPKAPRLKGHIEAMKLDVVFDVQQFAGKGLVSAVWYGWFDLVVEYGTPAQRDKALHAIPKGSKTLAKKDVQSIGSEEPSGPKLCVSWTVAYRFKDTPETLSSALHHHFDGTGYSSSYTFGRFDCPKGILRIIFHKAPPALERILVCNSSSFQERRFRTEVVTENDYPLQKGPISGERLSMTSRVTQKETKANAGADLAEVPVNGFDKEPKASAAENAAKAAEASLDDGVQEIDKDNATLEQQTMSRDQEIEQDRSAPEKALMTVFMDGAIHKIPTAFTLPLHELSFNTFARTYMQMEPQEPEKLTSKTLLKLYRTFLNSQFPDIEGEPIIEAYQRLDFEEAVINTPPGGLSYPFFIDSPYIYRKGLLVKAEKPQVTPAALSSAKHTTGDKALAQRSRAPSLDGGASCNTADKVAGSERKTSSSSQISSLSSSSASIELAPSAPPQPKRQKPDMLSALERYLDGLDARLQLKRELMATLHGKAVS